jgi:hypothetical protein
MRRMDEGPTSQGTNFEDRIDAHFFRFRGLDALEKSGDPSRGLTS